MWDLEMNIRSTKAGAAERDGWDAGQRRVFWLGILSAVAEVWTLHALRALYLVVTSQLHIFHFRP